MGLHAIKNIGFKFQDQEAAKIQWEELCKNYDSTRVESTLGMNANEEYVYVIYFDHQYRLNKKSGKLEKQCSDDWTEDMFVNEGLLIYHILLDGISFPSLSGEWVTESVLDPVNIRTNNRTAPLMSDFAMKCAKDIEKVKSRAISLGGVPFDKGDIAFEFHPFSFFPVRMIFWEADEDFPPQVQVLVDRRSTDYLHYEAVGFVIADLFTHLLE